MGGGEGAADDDSPALILDRRSSSSPAAQPSCRRGPATPPFALAGWPRRNLCRALASARSPGGRREWRTSREVRAWVRLPPTS